MPYLFYGFNCNYMESEEGEKGDCYENSFSNVVICETFAVICEEGSDSVGFNEKS